MSFSQVLLLLPLPMRFITRHTAAIPAQAGTPATRNVRSGRDAAWARCVVGRPISGLHGGSGMRRDDGKGWNRFGTRLPNAFCSGLIAVLMVLFGALAVQAQTTPLPKGALADTMIQWGDYDQFQIQGPRAARACQEACDRDPRCRAWTYLKTVSQCRLKHEPGLAVKNGCCVAGYKQLAPAAATAPDSQYAKQEYCADYARVAVRAQDGNLQQACGLSGTRWNTSYRDHYAYCLRAPRPEVDDETAVRADELARCTQSAARGQDAKCDHYVRATMVQLSSAQAGGCQVDRNDPRWAPSAEVHARACRVAPNRVLDNAIAERERQLAACFETAGSGEAGCTQYASTAVAQFQQNLANGCGLSGTRWHAGKARHYQWCRSASAEARTGETQGRKTDIARCVQQAQRTQRCTDYAKAATQSALRNDNIGCGLDGPGGRWSRYRDDHVAFCRSASEAALRGEDVARNRELTRCEARLQEVNADCDAYAKRSNRLSTLNLENNCGVEGDAWSTEYQDHYAYCLGANYEDRQALLQDKRRSVARCSNDRGFTLRLEF